MTIDTALASLVTATTQLMTDTDVTKASLDADLLSVTNSAISSTATNTSANAISGVASTQNAIITANETTAEANYDSVMSAWSAYAADAEVLSGVSQSLHFGTIVDSCIDLPSTHSDGGAWTDRCQDKSWYNEALSGKWLGRCASEFEARNVNAVLGPNLVTNGGFDSNTVWLCQSGWSISGGLANCNGTNSYLILQQGSPLAGLNVGAVVRVTVTVSLTSGTLSVGGGDITAATFTSGGYKVVCPE